jgi:hypothetical protein
MSLLLLEALGALLLLLLIVWWTMFSGRHKGELPASPDRADELAPEAPGVLTKADEKGPD